MNKISLVAAAAVMGLGSLSAQAGNTADVNVSVALTAKCEATSGPAALAFTYAAFQTNAATASDSVAFKCTRGHGSAPTATLDSTTGVVGGLKYTLTVGTATKTAGTAEDGSGNGTPDSYSYGISGSMPANQAGDSSASATQTRVLTVTY